MDGQHQYEIILKKEDLFINLSSDDVYFISKQMDKWCRILMDDSYVPVSLPQRPQAVSVAPPAPIAQEPLPVQQPVYAQPPEQAPMPPTQNVHSMAQPMPQPEPVPAMMAQPAVMEAQPQQTASQYADVHLPGQAAQPVPQPQPVAQPPQPMPQPVMAAPHPEPAFQQATQPTIPQRPANLGVPMSPAEQAAVQDDFEAVMDTLMKDLEEETEDEVEEFSMPVAPSNGKSMNGYKAEPDMSMINSLADLCDRSSAANSEDYLLLSAYYLSRLEHQEAFSLKKVNSILVKSGLTPVNHSVLETVLSRGYLAMVPDMTGMADVTEYMITSEGLQAATNLL